MSERKHAAPKSRTIKTNGTKADKTRSEQRTSMRAIAEEGARKHARTLDKLAE